MSAPLLFRNISFDPLKDFAPISLITNSGLVVTVVPSLAVSNLKEFVEVVGHDIDDAVRAGVLKESDLPRWPVKVLGTTSSSRIAAMVKDVVTEYLWACRQKGVLDVRIIHGKGTGALRRTVQSLLPKLPEVESFRSASERAGVSPLSMAL